MRLKEVVQRAVDRCGGINATARRLGLFAGQSVSQWLQERTLPSQDLEEPLAALADVDLEELRRLLRRLREDQARKRRERRIGGPLWLPPELRPGRPRRRRRGTAAVIIAGLSLGSLAGAPGQRPITAAAQVREIASEETSSVKSRSRRAA
jgi:transposase-like protein